MEKPIQPQLSQPSSRYTPSPMVDLSDSTTRIALSAGAAQAFFNIAKLWNLRDDDARALLGSPSNGTYYALKKGDGKPLDEDKLRRISALVGIFKALNILHGSDLADSWISRPNTNRIFAGATPLSYLQKGGLPAFITLRRLLDARRGGA